MRRWDNLAKAMFELASDRGEVFHLWGHSREIDIHNDWERLEEFLAWLSEQPGVVFACNADVPLAAPRALITAPYFKPHSGGLEEYSYQIAKGLQDTKWLAGHRGHVGQQAGRGNRRLSGRQGAPAALLADAFQHPAGVALAPDRLKQIIAAERPDVIVAHAPVPGHDRRHRSVRPRRYRLLSPTTSAACKRAVA